MSDQAIRVLLVEDTQPEADLTRLHLSRVSSGSYDLTHVTELKAALDYIYKAEVPDVILLDLHLPDCEGLGGFEQLKKLAPGAPVIILTNFMDDALAVRAVREGAQDYLIKNELDTALLTKSISYAIERQKSEAALRKSEERYALAIAGASEGIWDWNIKTGEVYFSPRWYGLVGSKVAQVAAMIDLWFDRVHPEDLLPLQKMLKAHCSDVTRHFEHEHRLRHDGEGYRWMLVRGQGVSDAHGSCCRMVGSMADITQRKRTEEQLLHDAMHDALTGLPNRSLFLDRLFQTMRQFKRDINSNRRYAIRRYAVLFLDLDRFKNVNDSLGHSVGDGLLVSIAQRLRSILRPSDTLARLSGDEFAVLINDVISLRDAIQVVERIDELWDKAFSVQGQTIYTSASIGIVMAAERYVKPEQILRDADLAMYRAKALENRVPVIFDAHMHAIAVQRLRIETDMRRALNRDEFVVHYQPIVSLKTGKVLSFEALVRWQHPERGMIGPDEFIDVAEETGMINELSWWILRETAAQTGRWQRLAPDSADLGISVNVTGALFHNGDIADQLLLLLESCNLEPRYMHLEITERSFMDHQNAVLAELNKLRAAGVQLHIDDFGTGYSSLSYLKRYSYDTLKIDRSFIRELTHAEESGAIVQAIVSLGKNLNMNIVAEGVENAAQVRFLREINCPEAQGFWFSRPLSKDKAHHVLQQPLRLN